VRQHIPPLSSVYADNGILHKAQPDFYGWAETVKRYGQWNEGVIAVSRQLSLWPGRDEG